MTVRTGLQRAALCCAAIVLGDSLLHRPLQARADSPAAGSDPQAVRIASEVWTALGGDAAWEKARYFRFDFVVEVTGKPPRSYRHWWDRLTGRYRVEGTNKEGQALVILFNVNDRTGRAWVDGKPAESEKTKD